MANGREPNGEDPYRENQRKEKSDHELDLPDDIKEGSPLPLFIDAINSGLDPKFFIINSPLTGKMLCTHVNEEMSGKGGLNFTYEAPATAAYDETRARIIVTLDKKRKAAKIENLLSTEKARGEDVSKFKSGLFDSLTYEKQQQAREIEIMRQKVRKEMEEGKINNALLLQHPPKLGNQFFLHREITDAVSNPNNLDFSSEEVKNPNKIVFYSLLTGVLRYAGTQTISGEKSTIYSYTNTESGYEIKITLENPKKPSYGNTTIKLTKL